MLPLHHPAAPSSRYHSNLDDDSATEKHRKALCRSKLQRMVTWSPAVIFLLAWLITWVHLSATVSAQEVDIARLQVRQL